MRVMDQKIGAQVLGDTTVILQKSLGFLLLQDREIVAHLFKAFLFGVFLFYAVNLTICLLHKDLNYKFLVEFIARKAYFFHNGFTLYLTAFVFYGLVHHEERVKFY